ncbi:MAG: Cj0069 family protein [Phycisphaerales bacterium]|nr:Cj0069 family protein [Phycisphaerales bacterium]
MGNHVVIFEARGGSDKGQYGYRNDSMPIVKSLLKQSWTAEIIFYEDEYRGEIYKYAVENATAYISRINPGNLEDETGYFQMLRELVSHGVEGLPHPDAMTAYGAKNALTKLTETELVPDDTYAYYDFEEFKDQFRKNLLNGVRVLKQNRGSTGEGIWRVELIGDVKPTENGHAPNDAMVRCTEAKDNHVEERELGDFIDFCAQYLGGRNGMIVDMPFMPRIVEGEIRVLMLRRTPVYVVHKKPAQTKDAFSATLYSGAEYTYQKPEEWPELMAKVEQNLDLMIDKLGGYAIPLLWTADFMLDDGPDGTDTYVLGEINASCVGFTTHLELADQVANEVVGFIEAEDIVNKRWPAYRV